MAPTTHTKSPWGLETFLEAVKSSGFDITPPIISSATGARVKIGSEELTDFASCSLLGLHTHPDVITSFQSAAGKFGLATGGSRLIQGRLKPIDQLEARVREWQRYCRDSDYIRISASAIPFTA